MDFNPAVLLVEPAAFAAGLAAVRVPVRKLEASRNLIFAVLAALSAIGAVATDGSATGWAPLDALLLAGLGGLMAYAGSRADSRLIAVGAAVAAIAGLGSVAFPLALGALGLALASVLSEAEPVVDAAAGVLLVQALLRAEHPDGRGLTALLAAVVLAPLLWTALRTLYRAQRRRIYRVALGVAAFSVAAGILAAVAAALSIGSLRQGLSVASRAVDATGGPDLSATTTALTEAGADFADARSKLDAWWTWPARIVPGVAQHLRVLRAAAVSGHELAGAGRRALSAPFLADVRVADGRIPLDQLAAMEPAVADLAARATAANQRLLAARSAFLLPPLASELDQRLERVGEITGSVQRANRLLPMLPGLLGGDGPRRYFLAVQTPVESRAGGGFMGNFGEIVVEDGLLTLARLGRQDDLNFAPGRATRRLEGLDEYAARYGRFGPEFHWANVNLSPDFPTNARVMANLYPQSGGAPVDGVIAVDPAALAVALRLVGPVETPSWPSPITADNVLQVLLHDQYEAYETRGAREDFLGEVAELAWGRLTGGNLPSISELLSAFGPPVGDKHIFFWSSRPEEQRFFEDAKVAGKVPPVRGDFVGLVTQNAVGNKIDYFLRREVAYKVDVGSGGRLRATARVALHNEAPAEGVGVQLIGNDVVPRLPSGTNKLYLSFYTPWELVEGRVDGVALEFERASELGRKVYSTAVVIPPQSTAVIELDLSGRLADTDEYRLDVYRQPMVAPDDVSVTVTSSRPWPASGQRSRTSELELVSDATVEVNLGG